MGMFDTILVHKNHIDSLITDEELKNNWKTDKNGLYYFQTKDLENFLGCYKVDQEGQLWEEEYLREFDDTKEWPYKVKHTQLPDKKLYVTQTIVFYDSVRCEINEIWVEFEAVFYAGKIAEIKMLPLKKDNILEKEAQIKAARERWDNIRNTWEWRLMGYIRLIERKCFYPIGKIYRTLVNKLQNRGENKYPIE